MNDKITDTTREQLDVSMQIVNLALDIITELTEAKVITCDPDGEGYFLEQDRFLAIRELVWLGLSLSQMDIEEAEGDNPSDTTKFIRELLNMAAPDKPN